MLRVAQWWVKPAIIFRMFSCVGLDFFNPSPFFCVLTQITLLMAANGLNLTQIPQISLNCTPDVKSHGGWQIGHGACRSTPSAPSTPISKTHTDFKNNLWKFVIICGRFLTTNFTNRTNNCFVESRWICVSPCSKGAEKFCEIFHPLKQKPWDLWNLCEALNFVCGIFGLCGEKLVP